MFFKVDAVIASWMCGNRLTNMRTHFHRSVNWLGHRNRGHLDSSLSYSSVNHQTEEIVTHPGLRQLSARQK